MALVLGKAGVGGYLRSLSKEYAIYAPVRRRDVTTFDLWADGDEVDLSYETTNSPPKRALFPPSDVLFWFKKGALTAPVFEKKVLVFGVHPYDAVGLKVLSEAFMEPVRDSYYGRRTRDLTVVAVEHGEVPNAFYGELGLDSGGAYDVILLDDGDRYILDAKTAKGNRLVKNGHIKTESVREREPRMPKGGSGKIDLKRVSRFLDRGPEHEVWHKLAEDCFACGVCAYVCPICHCFDVEDRPDLTQTGGERVRCWDSCMLADFAAVSGGGNFRGNRHERIHNWYHHKFSRALKERGRPDCVGCGRCITYCPAKIKIHDVIKKCEELG